MPIFDGDNLLITLDAPVGGVLELDVQVDLYSDWKEWVLTSPTNQGYPPAFRTIGGDALTPGIDAGAYYFINNADGWRIKPNESDHTVYAAGNLAPEDASLPVFIPTTGGFTVAVLGLQPITQSVEEILLQGQAAQYEGVVHIDQAAGTAGTAYPTGLPSQPVSNLTDALAILSSVGGNHLHFTTTLTLDQDLTGLHIIGNEAVTADTLDLNGYGVDNCYIQGCFITGAQGGTVAGFEAYKCGFQAVTSLAVGAQDCAFFNDVTLKPNSINILLGCNAANSGLSHIDFDINGATQVQAHGWSGHIHFSNNSDTNFKAYASLFAGTIHIVSTVSAGTFECSGTAELNNSSTGTTTVISDALLQPGVGGGGGVTADDVLVQSIIANEINGT